MFKVNHSFLLNFPYSDYWMVSVCSLAPDALLPFSHLMALTANPNMEIIYKSFSIDFFLLTIHHSFLCVQMPSHFFCCVVDIVKQIL